MDGASAQRPTSFIGESAQFVKRLSASSLAALSGYRQKLPGSQDTLSLEVQGIAENASVIVGDNGTLKLEVTGIKYTLSAEAIDRALFFETGRQKAQRSAGDVLARFVPSYYTDRDLYVPRDTIEKQLHDNVAATDLSDPVNRPMTTTILHGLGGTGKTQLAAHYFYHSEKHYARKYWLQANSLDTLKGQMRDLALGLQLVTDDEKIGPDEVLSRIKRYFAGQEGTRLFVFDDVDCDNFAAFGDYFNLPGVELLITTRNSLLDYPGVNRTPVEKMQDTEAKTMIRRYVPAINSDDNDLARLITALDNLPLALTQAGAYLRATKCLIGTYLIDFESTKKDILSDKSHQQYAKGEHSSVRVTWLLNKKRVSENCPEAIRYLEYAAWLNAAAMPMHLLKIALMHDNHLTSEAITMDEALLETIQSSLERYSLMQFDRGDNTASCHQLLQRAVRRGTNAEAQQKQLENWMSIIGEVYPEERQTMEQEAEVQHYLPHMMQLLAHFEKRRGKLESHIHDDALLQPLLLLALIANGQQRFNLRQTKILGSSRLCVDRLNSVYCVLIILD